MVLMTSFATMAQEAQQSAKQQARVIAQDFEQSLQLDQFQTEKLAALNVKYIQYFNEVMCQDMKSERRAANQAGIQKRFESEMQQLLNEQQYALFLQNHDVLKVFSNKE